jgi:hypothetical protein
MDERAHMAKLNIEHYRGKLLTEKDEAVRQQIARLLGEEEAKLTASSDPPENDKKRRKS